MLEFLEKEQIDQGIIDGIREYREKYPAAPELAGRVPRPRYHYYGKDVWEAAAAALLCGENLLLAGSKATGKNVLAENLAMAFGRPAWDVSFHVNMDAASLIGMDTFVGGQVTFRPGPVYLCAKNGGFGILDEINMAKNEALAVLHATLDFRRAIDVPGYDRVEVDPAARFIGTMNYGYAGTRELNEALPVSHQLGFGDDGHPLEVLQVGGGDQLVQVLEAHFVLGQQDDVLGKAAGLAAPGPQLQHLGVDVLEAADAQLLFHLLEKRDQHVGHHGRIVGGPVVVEGGQVQVLGHDVQLELVQLRQEILGQDQGVHIGGVEGKPFPAATTRCATSTL